MILLWKYTGNDFTNALDDDFTIKYMACKDLQ